MTVVVMEKYLAMSVVVTDNHHVMIVMVMVV
jgi:hypothetical protein